MKPTLDNATLTAIRSSFDNLTWPLIASLVEHFLVFGIYAMALDGGNLARICAGVSLAYWLVVLMILVRRRYSLSKGNLVFIAFGFPVMLFPSIYAITGSL